MTGGLALAGIEHRYGEGAWRLEVPAFAVDDGSFTGLIGPNGSGKSTLLRIAAGVQRPSAGAVRLDGRPLDSLERRQVARRLGYLPQEVSSLFDFSVAEVVRMGRYAHTTAFGRLRPADAAVVDRCMETCELADLRDRPLSRLSGGERKRALLASVLAQEPELLLLDEPTAALDLHHQVRFFQLLSELAGAGMGVVAVTHDVNLASLFCSRLVLLDGGRIVAEGPRDEVLSAGRLVAVYGEEVLIAPHPESGEPVVLPRRAVEAR